MIPAYLSPLANHLWQSTVFALIAGLLTLLLSNNRASVRYWLWLAASVKFLVPFSFLTAIGGHLVWQAATGASQPHLLFAWGEIAQPFALRAAPAAIVELPAAPSRIPGV